MDFGDLSKNRPFNTTLAPIHPGSETLLSRQLIHGAADLPIFLGAPQWTIKKFCRTLEEYVHAWNSIELNAAYYRNSTPDSARSWAHSAPADFRFFVKVHQELSHEFSIWSDSRVMGQRMEAYLTGWRGLGEKWAGSFLQLPPGFGFERIELLRQWIARWDGPPLYIEFRAPNWFEDRELRREAARLLAETETGVVCTDTPGRRDVSHGTLTTPDLFVRFLGQTTESDAAILEIDLKRLDDWTERIVKLRAGGLRQVIFFLHTPDLVWVPKMTRIFTAKLRACGFTVPIIQEEFPSPPQLSLF